MNSLSLRRGALLMWLGSLLLVIAGAAASLAIPPTGLAAKAHRTVVSRLAGNWDGEWYEGIVQNGYTFRTDHRSSIVFFPAYPLLAAEVHRVGVPLHLAMLITSNGLLAAAFAVFAAYLTCRFPGEETKTARWFALAAMAVVPSTFFFHVAYTEAMTLLLMVSSLYAMERRWHPAVVALIIGATTATRSTGVALLLPFVWYLWQWTKRPGEQPSELDSPITGKRLLRLLALLPLGFVAVWGLIGFVMYQKIHFGAPLAFMQAQMVWTVRHPAKDPVRRLFNLATGESIWATYLPGTAIYWNRFSCRNVPLLNLYFMNPLFFLGTVALVIWGRHRRWLNTPELLLSGMLLAIPYLLQSNRQGMVSEARFSAVVFPAYLVMGQLLAKMNRRGAYVVLGVSGVFVFSYTALFCAGYPFY